MRIHLGGVPRTVMLSTAKRAAESATFGESVSASNRGFGVLSLTLIAVTAHVETRT